MRDRLPTTNQLIIMNILAQAGGYMTINSILTVAARADIAVSTGSLTQATRKLPDTPWVVAVRAASPTAKNLLAYGITEAGVEVLQLMKALLGRLIIHDRMLAEVEETL